MYSDLGVTYLDV